MTIQATPPEIQSEVCVLGGGPAGAVMARGLAELGHKTLLVDRGGQRSLPCAESLAPSILPILDSLRLRSLIEAVVFRSESRGLLLWEAGGVQEKRFDHGPSLLIERTRFDRLLREAAVGAGADVMATAIARAPRRLPSGGWRIPVETSSGTSVVHAKFLVDARGRHRRGRLRQDSSRTAVISAAWEMAERCFPETRIEAGTDAWFWGSPLPGSAYAATIFVDSQRIGGLGGRGRMQLYSDLLARTALLKDLLQCQMIVPPRVRDATSGISGELIGNDFIRVGEAAVSLDPLASQGIQRAILSAIQGTAAVHTLLAAGHAHAAALQFYRERQQTAAVQARHHAARFYALRAHGPVTPFWTSRSLPAEDRTLPAEGLAIERTRQSRSGDALPQCLRPSPDLRVITVPVLAGSLVRQGLALSHPALEEPVAYAGGVALAPLVADADTASTTEQIIDRWSRHMAPSVARGIVAWMYAAGLLVEQSAARGDPSIGRN